MSRRMTYDQWAAFVLALCSVFFVATFAARIVQSGWSGLGINF